MAVFSLVLSTLVLETGSLSHWPVAHRVARLASQ